MAAKSVKGAKGAKGVEVDREVAEVGWVWALRGCELHRFSEWPSNSILTAAKTNCQPPSRIGSKALSSMMCLQRVSSEQMTSLLLTAHPLQM